MEHARAIEVVSPAASPEEAAAIVAAVEQFMRATAPPPPAPTSAEDSWLRAARLEAVAREPAGGSRQPWINT